MKIATRCTNTAISEIFKDLKIINHTSRNIESMQQKLKTRTKTEYRTADLLLLTYIKQHL